MRVLVEVCVSTWAEAKAAIDLGVDGLELCSWPGCGGTTPAAGLVRQCTEQPIQLRLLVRPGPGGFRYGTAEKAMLLADLDGVRGELHEPHIVTGALDAVGGPDMELMESVLQRVPPDRLTFHRAVDHMDDPVAALEPLAQRGLGRILSSGGAVSAVEGMGTLARMVAGAGNRLRVAAAGSIAPANVVRVVEGTGVQEVHFMARRVLAPDGSVPMASDGEPPMGPDKAKIEGVLNALVKAGLR
jgi:copper homeostasis protein